MDAIVDAAVQHMRTEPDLPVRTYLAHSMGWSSFEVARRLNAEGFAFAHACLARPVAHRVVDPDPPLSQLDDDRFVEALDRRYGRYTAEVRADRELMALLLPGLREGDIAALESHVLQAEPRLDRPLTVLGGSADPRAPDQPARCLAYGHHGRVPYPDI